MQPGPSGLAMIVLQQRVQVRSGRSKSSQHCHSSVLTSLNPGVGSRVNRAWMPSMSFATRPRIDKSSATIPRDVSGLEAV